jgi:hypothetical protein
MPAGSHGKTSTIFYRRGVPDNLKNFGALVSANYSIVQPSGRPDITSDFFKRSMSTFIATTR